MIFDHRFRIGDSTITNSWDVNVASSKRSHSYGKPPFLVGKLTASGDFPLLC